MRTPTAASLRRLADLEVGARFMVPGSGRLGRRVAGVAAARGELPVELNALTGRRKECRRLRATLLVQPIPEPPPDPVLGRAA